MSKSTASLQQEQASRDKAFVRHRPSNQPPGAEECAEVVRRYCGGARISELTSTLHMSNTTVGRILRAAGVVGLHAKFLDLTGWTFGQLTVLSYVGEEGDFLWRCRCRCGNVFEARGRSLKYHGLSCDQCWHNPKRLFSDAEEATICAAYRAGGTISTLGSERGCGHRCPPLPPSGLS